MKAVTEIIGKMNKDSSYIIRALQAVQQEEGYVLTKPSLQLPHILMFLKLKLKES